ncbi:Zinc finger BED domain-containing protein 4 [Merluccius polli]|uniref:Zinc finger BED domain-containing protein 4 n=1 Tax=Merluccius polli TaxID=89951 RepID=A0AA47M6P1_MERPO|nr:Zinc finger BED domain-containing protein 4 [Merluccius polli]
MEFIALDDQPFSVVEDVGFRSLMKVCLPEIHNIVATHIHELLARDITAISFTTDIWSSDVSPVSMLSLTVQWIDKDFNLIKAVLHSQEFTGTHSAAAISEAFEKMFQMWNIDKTRVHAVVRDNARNMTKAMMDSGLASFGCMAHTLQLAVHDGVFSQRSVTDVVVFKHSPLAYSRLQAVQIQLGMKPKRLQQDISTRWNSTFYMLESMLEQKRALATYAADYDLPATLCTSVAIN